MRLVKNSFSEEKHQRAEKCSFEPKACSGKKVFVLKKEGEGGREIKKT